VTAQEVAADARPVPRQRAVELRLPRALADVVGGRRRIDLDVAELGAEPDGAADVAAVLDAVAARWPLLERRIRDEAGALRRYVNVYVDGEDVRACAGVRTAVRGGSVVHVLPLVAGG